MAEAKQYFPPSQLDIKQIIVEAQHRWLRPAEICAILSNYKKFRIAPEPATMPPSGSLFLFDRKVLRYFRKDGHNWRKKKDGKTVREAHERLKAGSVDVLHCYYAHGEEDESFQRRTYWLLEEELSNIVLVHYRQVKGGTKANYTCAKENEESLPCAQQTDKIMLKAEMDTSFSSVLHPNSYQVPSQTMDSSMNSAQVSEYEEAESAFNGHASSEFYSFLELQRPVEKIIDQAADSYSPHPLINEQKKLPVIAETNYVSLTQDRKFIDILSGGLTYESLKPLGFSSWEDILENNGESQHMPFQPLFPEMQPDNMAVNSNFCQGYDIMVPHLTTSIAKLHDNGSLIQAEGSWQGYSVDSLRVSSWPIDNVHSSSTCEVSCSNCEHEVNEVDIQKSLQQSLLHQHKQDKVLMLNDPQEIMLDYLKSDFEASRTLDGIEDPRFTFKRTQLDGSPAEEGLKKLDSFNQWMSKELGDVEESNKPSTSGAYWDTVESESEVGSTTIPSQGHLDTYVLDPSVSNEQLFSIIDYSPSWAFEGSEVKIIISGRFLRSQQEAEQCKWSCMFGEVEVPAVIFGELLSLGHAVPQNSDSISENEKSQLRSKISSLLRGEDDVWDKLLELTQENDEE